MNKIEHIIKASYIDHARINKIIASYDLDKVLNDVLGRLHKNNTNIGLLTKSAGHSLREINRVLENIKSKTDKAIIEEVLSDIFKDFLNQCVADTGNSQFPYEVAQELKASCDYYGYDYLTLSRLLGLPRIRTFNTTVLRARKKIKPHYTWCRNANELHLLAHELKSAKILSASIKGFKSLFNENQSFPVHFNPKKKYELLILFQVMHERKLITVHNTSGHFKPLFNYSVDNQEKPLFKREPNKEHYFIKQNASEYEDLKRKACNLLDGIIR